MVELFEKEIILDTAPKEWGPPARVLKLDSDPLNFVFFPEAQKSWCATLHRGGKFNKFEVTTADRAEIFEKLAMESSTTAICRKDATLLAAGEDGSFGVYDAETGKLLCQGPNDGTSITGLNFWCGYVVVTDTSNYVKVYAFDGETLGTAWRLKMTSAPSAVELTTLKENILHVVVVYRESFYLQLFAQLQPDSGIAIPRCIPQAQSSCSFEGFALNPARTFYVAAVSHNACGEHESFLTITAGDLHDTDTKKTYKVRGDFSNAKISCNWDSSRVAVTDSLHRVHWLSLKGLDPLCLAAHRGPVKQMYVHTGSENEEIVTIADDGTAIMWTVPRD